MTETNEETAPVAAAPGVPAAEGAAPEEAPRKTTRRRTTKAKAAEEGADAQPAGAPAAEQVPEEAPKKTTRRRSTKAAEPVSETGADEQGEGEAPKKTTRRRSTKAKGAEEGASQAAAGEEAAKPKRTTRRRSVKAVEADAAEATEDAAPADAEEGAAKPKRTTRKRSTAKGADADEQTSEEAPKKTTRRRSTKAKGAEGEADAPAEGTTGSGAEQAPAAAAGPDGASDKETSALEESKKETAGDDGHDAKDAKDAKDAGESRNGKRRNRRNRRNRNNKQRKEIVPSATRDELAVLEDDELIAKALELEVDPTEYGERDDLVSAVYDALLQSEGFVMVEGILDLLPDGYGFIRTDGYLPGEHDVYVGMSTVRRNGLRKGDYITGRVRPPRENEKYPALNTIVTLNDEPFEGPTHRVKFANLTPIFPDERLVLEHGKDTVTARAIDLVSPIGKGQRGLIVSPPKAGKTTVLKDIAAAITANNPEVHLMYLGIDERPEEATDMERSIHGEVISSTFDMPSENHIAVAELVIERAKRLVEMGEDVVILLDSITRLARAYNLAQPASGRILSGGVDSTALYPPKRFLGAARNIEFGGSLTILGTALVDTGSKMDEVIFEEFKGTGNMELKLDRSLAEKRIFPAIDPVASSTRKDELLVDTQEAPLVWGLRRLLANMSNTERAMKMLIQSLKQTETNREFLVKSARKAAKTANL